MAETEDQLPTDGVELEVNAFYAMSISVLIKLKFNLQHPS